ncbi:MAG TPA: hypothetical protein VGU23_03820, partial [Acidobacteriaceae bacterium]|nr:hypothetical protein [Acidobacteriaceae bacterium]
MTQEHGTGTAIGTEDAGGAVRRTEQNVCARRASGPCTRWLSSALVAGVGILLVGTVAGCHKNPAQDSS